MSLSVPSLRRNMYRRVVFVHVLQFPLDTPNTQNPNQSICNHDSREPDNLKRRNSRPIQVLNSLHSLPTLISSNVDLSSPVPARRCRRGRCPCANARGSFLCCPWPADVWSPRSLHRPHLPPSRAIGAAGHPQIPSGSRSRTHAPPGSCAYRQLRPQQPLPSAYGPKSQAEAAGG